MLITRNDGGKISPGTPQIPSVPLGLSITLITSITSPLLSNSLSPVYIILHKCIVGVYVGASDFVCILELLKRQTETENVNIDVTIPADHFCENVPSFSIPLSSNSYIFKITFGYLTL